MLKDINFKLEKDDELSKDPYMLKFQKKDPFEDFLAYIDQNDERTKPTQEQREEMDERLKELGKIFEGTDIRWHLDGAFNISLFTGDYIGIHKDVDISVEAQDFQKLDEHLQKIGYGLFLSHAKDPNNTEGKAVLERIGGKQIVKRKEHPTIAAIDEKGKVRNDVALNMIDVHILSRNVKGQPIGARNVPIPDEWVVPQSFEYKDTKLNISHPCKVLYYKLHQTRAYDVTDMKKLIETGKISENDIDTVSKVIENELNEKIKEAEGIFKEIAKNINSESTSDEIYKAFIEHPYFFEIMPNEKVESGLKKLSEIINKLPLIDNKTITEIAFKVFKLEDVKKEWRDKIQQLHEWKEKS